jgi:NADH:ubiquinone oxidoreductase subunit F (NADH-binding)
VTAACRIESLAVQQATRIAPFLLRASCGWSTPVEQGVEWETHPARALWLGHTCVTALGPDRLTTGGER